MRYRKLQADYLFDGELILPEDHVLIIDEKGKIEGIRKFGEAGENIETYKGIISPGFINAHCHLELSHLKNIIPEKTGLIDFVFKIVTERHFPLEEMRDAIDKAEMQMIQNGIVAVGDICNNILTLSQKEKNKLSYYNFIETSGWLPEIAQVRFEKSKNFYDEFAVKGAKVSIVPHAPYSVSDNLWEKIIQGFPGKTISIHNQETEDEDLFFREGKGKFIKMYEMMNLDNSFYQPQKTSSVVNYFKKLSSAASVILVHNTFTQQEDLDFIKEHTPKDQLVSFCLCPNANLYIENKMSPIHLFLKNELNIILGTDSLASNHQLNILEEIKTIAKNFPEIKTPTLLKWATMNGAKSLQMDKELGSFEKGKNPGIILIENIEAGEITEKSKVKNLMGEV